MENFSFGRKFNSELNDGNHSLSLSERSRTILQSFGNILKAPVKKSLTWVAGSKTLSLLWKIFSTPVIYAIESRGGVILSYNDAERRQVIQLIRQIKRESALKMFDNEAYQIFMAVRRTKHIEGDLAEVGVYRGGSAKLIREGNGTKVLHLFDTFEGLPVVDAIDEPQFYKGQFAAPFDDVRNYLKGYKNVHFYKGVFPSTATAVEDKKFSFVHFDVDTYESTKSCLRFFYSRMTRGGVILSHDYISAAGVRQAFDEFFRDKVEPIIEMSGTQCLVVKL